MQLAAELSDGEAIGHHRMRYLIAFGGGGADVCYLRRSMVGFLGGFCVGGL